MKKISGILLIIIGILFMLDIQGIIHFNFSYYLFSWRSIVFFIAMIQIFRDKHDWGNWLFLYFALLINIPRISHYNFSELLSWTFPLGLILLGIMSMRSKNITLNKKPDIKIYDSDSFPKEYFLKTHYLGIKGKLTNVIISMTFSKIIIDLRDSHVDIMNPPCIQSTAFFTSYTFIVPPIWKIQTKGYQLFSIMKDSRNSSLIKINSDESHNLSLKIMNIFSSIEIQSHE